MKNIIRTLIVAGLTFAGVLGNQARAVSTEVISLVGQKIESGKSIVVSGTTAIDAAQLYTYSVAGNLAVSGSTLGVIVGGTSTSLSALAALVAPELLPYLSGTVVDISKKFPFVAANKLGKGSRTFGQFTVSGSVRLKAGITKQGLPYVDVSNVGFGVKTPIGTITDKTDFLVFTSGSLVISTGTGIGGAAAPDLSIVGPTGSLFGVGVTGTDSVALETGTASLAKGKSATKVVILQNIGSTAGTFKISAPAISGTTGFIQKITVAGKDKTVVVTGTDGFTTPSIPGGGVASLTWKIQNKKASSGAIAAQVLTAVTTGTGVQPADAVGFSATAK